MPAAETPSLIEIAMFDAQTGWGLGDDDQIYRTDSGGQTWQKLQPPIIETRAYLNVTYYDSNSLYIIANAPDTPPNLLYFTRDGGQTWSQTALNNLEPSFAKIVVLDPENLFLF